MLKSSLMWCVMLRSDNRTISQNCILVVYGKRGQNSNLEGTKKTPTKPQNKNKQKNSTSLMSWTENLYKLCISQICPLLMGLVASSIPWDPALCFEWTEHSTPFWNVRDRTHHRAWQKYTYGDCKFRFYTRFISKGGKDFLSHTPKQHVVLAKL